MTAVAGRPRRRRRVPAAVPAVSAVLALLVGWQLAVTLSGIGPYQTRSPLDVLAYLLVDGDRGAGSAAEHRAALLPMIGVTVLHAGIGLAVGVTASVVGAVLMTVSNVLRAGFLPLALVMQTVPLIAMAPVVYAVFGAGALAAAVVAAVVTFFPLLMNVTAGFASVAPQSRDLVHAYGGGRLQVLLRVELPSALPTLFAGLKLAAPATVSAATLYEFLFSFEGLGANLLTSRAYSDYGLLWTLVAVTVALALAAYWLVVAAERLALAGRFPPAGPDRGGDPS